MPPLGALWGARSPGVAEVALTRTKPGAGQVLSSRTLLSSSMWVASLGLLGGFGVATAMASQENCHKDSDGMTWAYLRPDSEKTVIR